MPSRLWSYSRLGVQLFLLAGAVTITLWFAGAFGPDPLLVLNPQMAEKQLEWFEIKYQHAQTVQKQLTAVEQALEEFRRKNGDPKTYRGQVAADYNKLNTQVVSLSLARSEIVYDYNRKADSRVSSLLRLRNLPELLK